MKTSIRPMIDAAVAAARKFTAPRSRAAALRMVRLVTDGAGRAVATATDLESSISVTVHCGDEPGAGWGDGMIDPKTGDESPDVSPLEFPAVCDRVSPDAAVAGIAMRWHDLALIADHIAPVCDNESSRFALGAVRIERDGALVHAVGTDARRMHILTVEPVSVMGEIGANVWGEPLVRFAAAVRLAMRAATGRGGRRLEGALAEEVVAVTFTAAEAEFALSVGMAEVRMRVRLAEGRFPGWRNVCECYTAGWTLDGRLDGAEAVATFKQASAVAKRIGREVPGARRDGFVTVAARVTDEGLVVMRPSSPIEPTGPVEFTAAVPAGWPTFAGRPAKVALDPTFMVDAVEAAAAVAGSDEVPMVAGGPAAPVCIRVGNHGRPEAAWGVGFSAVVMPMAQ